MINGEQEAGTAGLDQSQCASAQRQKGQRSFGLSVVYAFGISCDNLLLAFR